MVTQLKSKGILSRTQDSVWQKDFFFPAAGKGGDPKSQINIFLARWSLLLSLHFLLPPKNFLSTSSGVNQGALRKTLISPAWVTCPF